MTEQELLTNDETEAAGGDGEDFQAKLKEAIDVSVAELGGLRRKLTVTVPRALIDERTGEQYKELSRDALIPGFRKGRAPQRLVEKRFGAEVNSQLLTQLVSAGYMAAIDKVSLKVVTDPLLLVAAKDGSGDQLLGIEKALDQIKIPEEGDFTFRCEVEVRPEFELPKLEGIQLKKPKITIDDDDVQEQIDRLRALRGQFEPVEDAIEEDDLVICELRMTVESKEIAHEPNVQLAARGQRVQGVPLPELGEALAGKSAGESVTVEAEVPEDHEKAELRGKRATFEIKIHDVKRLRLPELNAEMLSAIGFESEADLRAWVRGDMESRLAEALQEGLRNQMVEHLLEATSLELPEQLSARQTERATRRKLVELFRQGVPETEINKHLDELRTSAQTEAAAQLKLEFVLEKISEEWDMQVSEEEVNARIAQIAARYHRRFDRVRDELSKGDGLTSLYLQLRDEKVLDRVVEQAEISEMEPTAPKKPSRAASKKKAEPAAAEKAEEADESEGKSKAKSAKKTTKKSKKSE